jgi:hypothetical protein
MNACHHLQLHYIPTVHPGLEPIIKDLPLEGNSSRCVLAKGHLTCSDINTFSTWIALSGVLSPTPKQCRFCQANGHQDPPHMAERHRKDMEWPSQSMAGRNRGKGRQCGDTTRHGMPLPSLHCAHVAQLALCRCCQVQGRRTCLLVPTVHKANVFVPACRLWTMPIPA